eukprot:gene6445-7726_t
MKLKYVSWAITVVQVALAWYAFSEFIDINDKIDDCSVTGFKDETYKTSHQGKVMQGLSAVCASLLSLTMMLVGILTYITDSSGNGLDDFKAFYVFMEMCTGALGYITLVMTAVLTGIHHIGYPYNTLEDLYGLLENISTEVKFVDCGKPKREESLTLVLYLQLALFALSNGAGLYMLQARKKKDGR